jgi:hypothetical protein
MVDWLNIIGMIVVGATLIFGLFERFGVIVGM